MPRYYPDNLLRELARGYVDNTRGLQELRVKFVSTTYEEAARVREFAHHGVARRLGVLEQAIVNVFSEFPPETEVKLDSDKLLRVQMFLQAFFINLVGVFDNMAWCFVLLHDATAEAGGRHHVGMFKDGTKRILPAALRQHVSQDDIVRWHDEYLKNYRDALAHRIPLYIPPASITEEEGRRLHELQPLRLDAIRRGDFNAADALSDEQEAIGSPCFVFTQSLSEEEASIPILLHPQMLSDAATVVEFGKLFLQHWRTRAPVV